MAENLKSVTIIEETKDEVKSEVADAADAPTVSIEIAEQTATGFDLFKWRNLVAFWIFGYSNYLPYFLIIYGCFDFSLNGFILLLGAVPALLCKISPFFMSSFFMTRVIICCILHSISLVLFLIFFSPKNPNIIIYSGTILLPIISCGLGEVTFLSYSAHYKKSVLSAWSAGRGSAGIICFMGFLFINQKMFDLKSIPFAIYMFFTPVIQAFAFFVILKRPIKEDEPEISIPNLNAEERTLIGFRKKIGYVPKLFKYIIWLGLVFMLDFVVCQKLFQLRRELKTFGDKSDEQLNYLILHILYYCGIFLSSITVIYLKISKIWIFLIIQSITLTYLLIDPVSQWTPKTIILLLIFWEGFICGCAYVNIFYKVYKKIRSGKRHFALGITTIGSSVGTIVAAILAMMYLPFFS